VVPIQPPSGVGSQIEKFLNTSKGEGSPPEGPDNIITLNFKDVPLIDAIAVLSKQSGMNITLDRDIPNNLVVTSIYSGTSVENALRSITSAMDLSYKKTPDGFLLRPWDESYIDINKVYLYAASTGGSQFGATGNSSQQSQQNYSQGGGLGSSMASIVGTQANQYSASQVSISDFGGYMDAVINQIKPMLSKQGVVTYMPTGFLYVRDYPSRVRAIEEMFDVDNSRREEVDLKITIIRIDYNKDYQSGINWTKVFQGFQVGNPSTYSINSNFLSDLASQTANVLTFKYKNTLKNIDLTAQLLSSYGNVKIVHSWETRALTGSVLPFDLTQLVWYSMGSIIQVINNQTITTPQVSNTPVGISITLNPEKYGDGYLVNTSIRMSSVVSQQTIEDLTFPNIENNAVSVPIKLLPGEQIAISGFKVKNTTKNNVGFPILSQLPILEYLFGYKSAQTQNSEIAVVISVNKKNGEQQI
jgi:type II secretory pathway component GspD/PulD (secretin)